MAKNLILSEINVYPIKSLGGISLDEAAVEKEGLEFDRRMMLVDADGKFISQREFPQMATLKTALEKDGITVEAKTGEKIFVPFAGELGEKTRVSVWASKSIKAESFDEKINQFFSDILSVNCRLVRMTDETKRIVSPFYAVRKYKDTVSFADGYPVLLIGESSLADLNSRLENPVPMNRFRPNLVIKNAEAFAEDGWKKIQIGETVFHIVKPCARCVMTAINQETGKSEGKEPLKTLAAYRLVKRGGESKINFGQNLIPENGGAKIKIGDQVEILEIKRGK